MFTVTQKVFGDKNERIVIVIGGWRTTQTQLWLLGQLLSSYKFKAIVVTYSPEVISIHPDQTYDHILSVVQEVSKTITSLPKKQQKDVSLFGMSLGTDIAFLVATKHKITKMVLNLSGSDLAETIWSLDKVEPALRKGFEEKHITLATLQKKWGALSPINTISEIKTKHILFYLAKRDEFIPFSQQESLLRALQEKGIRVEAFINERHSHFVSALINLLRFQIYINFLMPPKEESKKRK